MPCGTPWAVHHDGAAYLDDFPTMLPTPETEVVIYVVQEEASIVAANGLPCCQSHDTASIHTDFHRRVSVWNSALMSRWFTLNGYWTQYCREMCSSPLIGTTHESLNQPDRRNRVLIHQEHPFVPLAYRHAGRLVECTSHADILLVRYQYNPEFCTEFCKHQPALSAGSVIYDKHCRHLRQDAAKDQPHFWSRVERNNACSHTASTLRHRLLESADSCSNAMNRHARSPQRPQQYVRHLETPTHCRLADKGLSVQQPLPFPSFQLWLRLVNASSRAVS